MPTPQQPITPNPQAPNPFSGINPVRPTDFRLAPNLNVNFFRPGSTGIYSTEEVENRYRQAYDELYLPIAQANPDSQIWFEKLFSDLGTLYSDTPHRPELITFGDAYMGSDLNRALWTPYRQELTGNIGANAQLAAQVGQIYSQEQERLNQQISTISDMTLKKFESMQGLKSIDDVIQEETNAARQQITSQKGQAIRTAYDIQRAQMEQINLQGRQGDLRTNVITSGRGLAGSSIQDSILAQQAGGKTSEQGKIAQNYATSVLEANRQESERLAQLAADENKKQLELQRTRSEQLVTYNQGQRQQVIQQYQQEVANLQTQMSLKQGEISRAIQDSQQILNDLESMILGM